MLTLTVCFAGIGIFVRSITTETVFGRMVGVDGTVRDAVALQVDGCNTTWPGRDDGLHARDLMRVCLIFLGARVIRRATGNGHCAFGQSRIGKMCTFSTLNIENMQKIGF